MQERRKGQFCLQERTVVPQVLPNIETERVAEALVDMYSRLGIPEEMLTDQGSLLQT
ncbi:hypothetical protein DPMN_180076 [Dreissena polymorpha]|uniref:Uncharacterized protein n=1 Tax=Dreissena polymorpha TaxID=45954 RepID=A0A9D4EIF7_DREPO|nr:hypothetical protein DPMN_180076 [Dreissena polymorpha]